MFILPPNCIVPSATSLTMRPVFPSFLYFISHTPCGRSGRHQIDTFESTWPGQNWALTEWPVNVDSSRPHCAHYLHFRNGLGNWLDRSPRESLQLASGVRRPYCLPTNDRAELLKRPSRSTRRDSYGP